MGPVGATQHMTWCGRQAGLMPLDHRQWHRAPEGQHQLHPTAMPAYSTAGLVSKEDRWRVSKTSSAISAGHRLHGHLAVAVQDDQHRVQQRPEGRQAEHLTVWIRRHPERLKALVGGGWLEAAQRRACQSEPGVFGSLPRSLSCEMLISGSPCTTQCRMVSRSARMTRCWSLTGACLVVVMRAHRVCQTLALCMWVPLTRTIFNTCTAAECKSQKRPANPLLQSVRGLIPSISVPLQSALQQGGAAVPAAQWARPAPMQHSGAGAAAGSATAAAHPQRHPAPPAAGPPPAARPAPPAAQAALHPT